MIKFNKGSDIDFYCEGFRWFDNYEAQKQSYQKLLKTPNDQQYYGQHILVFENISDLNCLIQKLTLLRDTINTNTPKHPNIHKEFGNNGINNKYNLPYTGINN